ncbi:MAG: hypothetical protein RLZZ28_882 [Bacteroidota bacterium]
MRSLLAILLVTVLTVTVNAQAVLPDFTLRELTRGKNQISWVNPYPNCIQLAIQRSSDSSKNFRTIYSAQSPELANNGYLDKKPLVAEKNYYRIFYVLKGGAYYFTAAKSIETIRTNAAPPIPEKTNTVTVPASTNQTAIYFQKKKLFDLSAEAYKVYKDSINNQTSDGLHRVNENTVEWQPAKSAKRKELVHLYKKNEHYADLDPKAFQLFIDSVHGSTLDTVYFIDSHHAQLLSYVPVQKHEYAIYKNDTSLFQLNELGFKQFKDSISKKTKDTLFAMPNDRIDIHVFQPKYVWRPSIFVFTNPNGYVSIQLPQVSQHKYQLVFYDFDGTELFRIKTIKESLLLLDKTDFMHAGWFSFELFEDDKLKEKNKFFIPKD